MATTDKIAYGTSTAITCTLASLASSATVGRGCLAVDNTTNLFDDAMLTVGVTTTVAAADLACYVYLYGSEDGTVYTGSAAEAPGTNIAVTVQSPTNMKGPYIIACPVASGTYRLVVPSVAGAFGGIIPRKWGFVLVNTTGGILNATEGNHQKTYTGIYFQNL